MDFALANSVPVLPALRCLAAAGGDPAGAQMMHLMQRLVVQLAVILVAARLGGRFAERYLKVPGVLGELLAGALIGPFALGGMRWFGLNPLFPPVPGSLVPVSPELYGMATLASLLLLFLSGLETDLGTFLRYSTVGTAVGVGGVVVSFALGDAGAVWLGFAPGYLHPTALFLGTVSTATSVGITARILTERRKTDSPEGVTILAGAVLDDVLGIVVLAVVVSMSAASRTQEHVPWGHLGVVLVKTLGWWLGFTVAGIVLARRITRVLKALGSHEVIASLALGLALLVAGLLETVGLAMIIGAYITGLALSRTDLVHVIRTQMHGAYVLLVPVFFSVMGMMIDFRQVHGALGPGLAYAALAVAAKIVGCGFAAWATRFNLRGALRVGIGMVPRGEVALIVAGIGLSSGAVSSSTFGVAVLMTILTTVVAPPLLVRVFHGPSGLRRGAPGREGVAALEFDLASPEVAEFVLARIVEAFRQEGFLVHAIQHSPPEYQARQERAVITICQEGARVRVTTSEGQQDLVRLVLLEELLHLGTLAENCRRITEPSRLKGTLAESLFD